MKRTVLVALCLAAVALAAGCQQEKFTRARYDTLYVGQPDYEVEMTLGEPDARFSDTWSYLHDEPFYKAIIEFDAGRVKSKTWYDEQEMGEHPDLK